jgi:hypothetical protein
VLVKKAVPFTELEAQKISDKIKALRIKRGYTSYENFAYENDIPRLQYWRIEKGAKFHY